MSENYYEEIKWAPQGWQCPICKRVYSPSTYMCFYCGQQETSTTTISTDTANFKPDTTKTK